VAFKVLYKFVDKNSPYNGYGDIKFESVLETNSYILMNWGWNNLVGDNLYINSPTANWTQGGHTFCGNKMICITLTRIFNIKYHCYEKVYVSHCFSVDYQ
jgi:hypothetical protein